MVAARPSVLIHARDTVLVSFELSSPGGAIKFAMVLKRVDASLIITFSSRSHRQAARFLLVVILVHGDPARFFLLPPIRHLRGRSGPFLTEHSPTTQLERHRLSQGTALVDHHPLWLSLRHDWRVHKLIVGFTASLSDGCILSMSFTWVLW